MKAPQPAVCSDPECINAVNARTVLCCSVCGRCGDHSHQDCDAAETVHGRLFALVPWSHDTPHPICFGSGILGWRG